MDRQNVTHDLKCHPDSFRAAWIGLKTCEFRRNDRGFMVGDWIVLHEYAPCPNGPGGEYSGRRMICRITHANAEGKFGIPEGYVMLSIRVEIRDDWKADVE